MLKSLFGWIPTFVNVIPTSTNVLRLQLLRYSSQSEYTLGLLFMIDPDGTRRFLSYTLEDEARTMKVYAETRVPAGIFKVIFRTVGGFHDRYLNRFGPVFHKGMLWLQDVPGFEYILLHIGNDADDTAGCILLGDSAEPGFIGRSTNAYRRIYEPVRDHLLDGGEVEIEIINFDAPIYNA